MTFKSILMPYANKVVFPDNASALKIYTHARDARFFTESAIAISRLSRRQGGTDRRMRGAVGNEALWVVSLRDDTRQSRASFAVRELQKDDALLCAANGADLKGFFFCPFIPASAAFPLGRLLFFIQCTRFHLLIKIGK